MHMAQYMMMFVDDWYYTWSSELSKICLNQQYYCSLLLLRMLFDILKWRKFSRIAYFIFLYKNNKWQHCECKTKSKSKQLEHCAMINDHNRLESTLCFATCYFSTTINLLFHHQRTIHVYFLLKSSEKRANNSIISIK